MFSLLYIDDEPGLLELGRLFLENTGEFTVTTALSGDAGLAYLARQDFDAVISDYQMPGMDGISLLKNVRKSFGNIPFILFTGRGREEVVIEAINNGVDFYLQKGGDPKSQFAELAHKVRQAMNRRRAETALSDSEKRLADIINFLPDATFAIDTHGVVIAWNRAMERMTGVRSDEILGKGNYEYALPFYHERRPLLINLVLDDDPAIAEKYPFVKKEGKTLFSEITIPHFNDGMGAALWFTASPLYNRNGEVVGAIESIRDITERKRAEEDLVSANSEYTNLLDQIQDIYYRSDTEGRLVRASRSWATLFGYDDVSECLGRSIADDFYVNPSDRKRLLEEIYRNGKVTGYEALLKKKDGTPVLVEASSHLSFDPAGNIIGIEGIFRDITARKKGEEALNESERRFRELAELLPQGIYEADANGRMQFVNRLALEMSGYTPEDIGKGLNALDVIAPDDRQRAAMVFRQIVEQGTRSQGSAEYTALRKDGTTFPVSILSTAILRGGRIAGVRGVIMDITERKRAEEELRAVNEQLVASQEELRSQYDELAESEKRIRMSETRLTYMLGFYEYSQKSEKELLEYAIEGAGIVTGSPLGYLAFLNEDESQLTMYAWSRTAMAECLMREKPIIYKTEKTGLWGEAVRQRRPVITNDYAAPNPAKKGYPEGHPRIIRHMNVPVLDEGRIVLVAGVANKPSDYTEKDVNELLLLMQGLWTIIKRKRLQEEQKAAYEQISASEEELRQQYGELAATQEDLQRHKVQLDEIAGTLPGVIYQFYARPDGSMGLYYVSSRAADVFGISSNPEDFFERFTQHVDTRDRDAFLQSNVDVARDGLPWHYEGRFIRPSGEEIWFEGISRPIRRGTELVFNGVLLDITGRKRAEEALFNSQQMLQAVLDSIPQRVFWKDRNSVFLGCNKPLALDAGFSEPADMVGKTDYDHASHETAELYRADDRRVMETGQPRINYEEPQIRVDGSHAWLRTTKVPLRNKEGTIIGVLGTYEDITEHKRAEEVLRTRSEEYQNILRTAMDGFCIVAMDGSFIDVNDAFCKSLGYTREEVITLSLPRIEVRETPEETARHAQDIIRKGWDRFETRFRQKNGGIIDVEVSIVYTELHGGRFITFSRDITERKKATEELRLLKISADRSSDEVFWMDFTGKILYVNDAACKATGYSRDEFAAMKIFELDPDFPPKSGRRPLPISGCAKPSL